eukprot:scaffold6598_cov162-Alexandrium_tamarense.AAC.3
MGWESIEEMSNLSLRDELQALLDKEKEYVLPVLGNPQDTDNTVVSSLMKESSLSEARRSVCQWNYECVDYFMFDREVVYMSMNYYDRYMAGQLIAMQEDPTKKSLIPSAMLSHLLALTCLQLACKLHGEVECHPSASASGQCRKVKLRLEDFCHMSRGTYCISMMEEMELAVLTNLKWKLHPPTPLDFLMRFVKILSVLLNDTDDYELVEAHNLDSGWSVFEVARYQTELAVYSPELCQNFSPSKIALAAILNAMNSKIVSSKRTVISSHVRDLFLDKVHSLSDGFAHLEEGDEMVQARTLLKKLCSKSIILPGKVEDETTVESESTEYELPEIQTFHYDCMAANSTYASPRRVLQANINTSPPPSLQRGTTLSRHQIESIDV